MANTYIVIAASILFCIGLIGNSITVCFVAVSKRLHTPTYVLIGCLAVSDVLASVTRYVQIFYESLFYEYYHLYIYEIFTFLFINSAFFHMVLVSYVRFVFIANPLHSLNLTCKRILWMSFAIWISSVVVSIGYGAFKVLDLMNIISFETAVLAEIGFGLYVSGIPFIIVIIFNVRKLYYLYNQTASVRRTRIANSMSLMFWIIIVIYLLSTIYPLFYVIDYAVLKERSLLNRRLDFVQNMFSFSLLVNSCLNPLIYFMFSPPVLRLLSRLRKCCNHGKEPHISNPRSCPQVESHGKPFFLYNLM
ncbi:melanocyte-stimulating hormone receptor-like [Crassostrea angulata]|uniref:melanocyte-stimulating hormone receptor-like n=1 Tax=Magallana angulata TaxID=2784310 RepID=UPI00148A5EA9|nr:melanocyte-stimulating hormone receptor-like [Crassostrea gigas]XP_052692361.1 melanocyte-stimulating hormone receptor-like [Crassostrea angulata]